jgi:hypothetical protein
MSYELTITTIRINGEIKDKYEGSDEKSWSREMIGKAEKSKESFLIKSYTLVENSLVAGKGFSISVIRHVYSNSIHNNNGRWVQNREIQNSKLLLVP